MGLSKSWVSPNLQIETRIPWILGASNFQTRPCIIVLAVYPIISPLCPHDYIPLFFIISQSVPWYPFISHYMPFYPQMCSSDPPFFSQLLACPRFCSDSAASLLSGGPMRNRSHLVEVTHGYNHGIWSPKKLGYHPTNHDYMIIYNNNNNNNNSNSNSNNNNNCMYLYIIIYNSHLLIYPLIPGTALPSI